MTQQYQQNNINSPRGSRLVSVDTALNLDDDLVVVDSSNNEVTLDLPNATQIPGQQVKIKVNDPATNVVTVRGINGQTIDTSPSVNLTTAEQSLCLESDGENWRIVCGDSGGDGDACCAPVLLTLPGNFQEQQINVPAGSTTFTLQATKVDEEPTARVLEDTDDPGAEFSVTNVSVSGSETQSVEIEVELDSGNNGSGWVVLENECGCCTLMARVTASVG